MADDAIGGDTIVTKDMKPWEGCGECHDLDGVAPNGHFPSLAAQKPAYLLKQMEDFRDERRHNDHGQMGTSSREIAGPVLDRVIAYFAALPPPPPPLTGIDPAEIVGARKLFAEGSRAERIPPCANCHGAKPKHEFNAPCLQAQQGPYLAKQLRDFKSGRRTNDPDGAMQKVARNLSNRDIAALAAYLSSQERRAPSASACRGASP